MVLWRDPVEELGDEHSEVAQEVSVHDLKDGSRRTLDTERVLDEYLRQNEVTVRQQYP